MKKHNLARHKKPSYHSNKGRKVHKPKQLKLVIPHKVMEPYTTKDGIVTSREVIKDGHNGFIDWYKELHYDNGILHLGRVYIYHPTKGWRSRSEREFIANKSFGLGSTAMR